LSLITCVYSTNKKIEISSIADNTFAFLNSNQKNGKNYLAIGVKDSLSICDGDGSDVFKKIEKFQTDNIENWMFGYFGYDLKNNIEKLNSKNIDNLNFANAYFFVPKITIEISRDLLMAHFDNNTVNKIEVDDLISLITTIKNLPNKQVINNFNTICRRQKKEEYVNAVSKIKNHIQKGDIYEANYCQEFYAENIELDPLEVYTKLNEITRAPFSVYFKNKQQHLICGSPERYLKKTKSKILSQPIKGTAKRGQSSEEDNQIILKLTNSKKEKSENIMIVDLVRNDLSKIAKKGTVQVEELFKLNTFNNIHQMISSVSCQVKDDTSSIEVMKQTFPMGSMTGVPKIRAMEIIDELETSRRGLFSGCFGYFEPNGNFDFNVIIRSIIYNSEKKYASIMAGGAITIESDPAAEYEESLLKASAMIEALNGILHD
jgi:para-aminobenzoate synthetase component I